MYANINKNTPDIVSSSTTFPSIFTLFTLLGWRILSISLLMALKIITILIVLIPPPVEPAIAPINISIIKITLLKVGHKLKFTVAYPVVVTIDDTWNAESLIDLVTSPWLNGIMLTAIIIIEANTAIKYHFNSSLLKNALTFPLINWKYKTKFTPNKSMKIVIIHSTAGLLKAATLAFILENPPVPAVPKACIIESYHDNPALFKNIVSINVNTK